MEAITDVAHDFDIAGEVDVAGGEIDVVIDDKYLIDFGEFGCAQQNAIELSDEFAVVIDEDRRIQVDVALKGFLCGNGFAGDIAAIGSLLCFNDCAEGVALFDHYKSGAAVMTGFIFGGVFIGFDPVDGTIDAVNGKLRVCDGEPNFFITRSPCSFKESLKCFGHVIVDLDPGFHKCGKTEGFIDQ